MFSIDRGTNIGALVNIGLSPQTIGILIDTCMDEGFITQINDEEVLTDKGMEFLTQDKELCIKSSSSIWIMPMYKFRTDCANASEVYLPERKQLKWLGQAR